MSDVAETKEVPSSPKAVGGPRRPWGLLITVGALCAALGAAGGVLGTRASRDQHDHGASAEAGVKYQCPMHPSIIQDHPGTCPICGMKLVKVAAATTAPPAAGERRIAFYRSPMDPRRTSPAPRKDEMGMDYVPVYQDELESGASAVPGMASVNIDPQRQQLIGLRTADVMRAQVGGQIRTVGHVGVDETRVRRINVKNEGFVERVFVDFVGKRVRKGDRLFTYYSPELLAAQEELLTAIRRRPAPGTTGPAADGVEALVEAARRRLRLWDVSAAELERLERTGEASRAIAVHSPIAGVVSKKDVYEGMKLEAGAMPYEIVDLGTVWVQADVYETELRLMRPGLAATLALKAFPGRTFEGKVAFVDPFLDPNTRTVRVRIAFPNRGGELRPEMFGEVVLETAPHEGLTIPFDAIIDSGTTKVVFIALGEGKFEPREVEVGASGDDVVEVVRGLTEGERVVTRANFLIDSESRLRASLDALSKPEPERARVLPPSGAEASSP